MKINFILLYFVNIVIRESKIIDPLVNNTSTTEFITTCTNRLSYVNVYVCVFICLTSVSLVKYELRAGGDFTSLTFLFLVLNIVPSM